MSGLAYLGWVDRNGTRCRNVTPLSADILERLIEALKTELPDIAHFAVPLEELETWMMA
jgi:hypothetical protein